MFWQKKIETAAKKAGHNVKIETQGTIGIENPLTADEIAAADIVDVYKRQEYQYALLRSEYQWSDGRAVTSARRTISYAGG